MTKQEKEPKAKQESPNVDEVEVMKTYFEEFKYRHDLFWKVFFFLNTALFFVIAIPFLYSDKLLLSGSARTWYSVLVGLLIVFSLYALFNEHARISWTFEKLNKLRKDEKFARSSTRPILTRYYLKLLIAAFGVFFAGLLAISIFNPPNSPAAAPMPNCCVIVSTPTP
jgi:hypothetical protein